MTSVESDALASFLRSRGAVVHEALELFGAARGTDDRGVFAVEPIQQGTLLSREGRIIWENATACPAKRGSGPLIPVRGPAPGHSGRHQSERSSGEQRVSCEAHTTEAGHQE